MMMMSFVTIGIVSTLWVIFGYNWAFGSSADSPWIGGWGLSGLGSAVNAFTNNGGIYPIPTLVFSSFQLMFAIITPALISGAIADRTKFTSWAVFVTLWVTIVYFPVAHWVFGSGLLWFGWFGFNAGSALGANGLAGLALINTQVATGAALIGWLLVEKIRDGHATSLGAASGAVAGLVAITPACAFVAPWAAVVLGFIAGIVCAMAVGLKYKFGFDDSLDVVGVHLVGGIWGCLSIGFFATKSVNSIGGTGLFYGGGLDLLKTQAFGAFFVLAYSFIVTLILGFVINKTIGFRVSQEAEINGIDLAEHRETAYEMFNSSRGGITA
jgi:Amt family ammonium transporter